MMRTITIPKGIRVSGSGAFGAYYRLSKLRGLKVFRSSNLSSIQKESNYLNMAAAIGLAPKCHEIVKVKMGHYLKLAIVVTHIEGKKRLASDDQMANIDKKLRSIGIGHYDLHEFNIIKNKSGKYKIVDFSPYRCRMLKRH